MSSLIGELDFIHEQLCTSKYSRESTDKFKGFINFPAFNKAVTDTDLGKTVFGKVSCLQDFLTGEAGEDAGRLGPPCSTARSCFGGRNRTKNTFLPFNCSIFVQEGPRSEAKISHEPVGAL